VRRIATDLMNKYPDRFGTNFEQNKKTIVELAIVRSKELRNQVAGYIASHLNKQSKSSEPPDSLSSEAEWQLETTLIIVKLLGSIQKTVNTNTLYIDEPNASISYIMSYLRNHAIEPDLIDEKNFLIAINGIESSLFPKGESVIKSGDTVTVASLVHGG
jgi:ribosomal protein S17E